MPYKKPRVQHALAVWLTSEEEAERASSEARRAAKLHSTQRLEQLVERAHQARLRANTLHDELLAELDALDTLS
jgi:hypothetical protein